MRFFPLCCLLCFGFSFLPAAASNIGSSSGRVVSFPSIPIVFEVAPGPAGTPPAMFGRLPGALVRMSPGGVEIQRGQGAAGNLRIVFRGANADAAPRGQDRMSGETNYLIGRNPADWRVHVRDFRRAEYQRLYPGVDAVFYGNAEHLEDDFIVRPGADYRQIRMQFSKKVHVALSADGDLRLSLPGFGFRMHKPKIYQVGKDGRRESVPGRFRILPDGDVGFIVGRYDARRALIIDPVLSFSTYLAASPSETSFVATDSTGATYVTGTGELGYPVTPGAFSGCAACSANEVVTYVSKYSADGKTLIYSTLLGGSGYTQPFGIVVNANGEALVAGRTQSDDYPVKNNQKAGADNNSTFAFLTSLSADGSALVYSTLLGGSINGGSSTTIAEAIALDQAGNAYITGTTDASAFPITKGALEAVVPAYPKTAIYLTKFDPTGALVYSAILGDAAPQNGGGGPIGASALAVDSSGDAYVTGQAGSLWPVTQGVYQSQIMGAQPYAAPFVTKMAPDGASLLYSTFFGNGYQSVGIAVLPNGNVWLAGIDPKPGFPITPDAYESSPGATYLSELDATGSNLLYSTYLAASVATASAMAVGADGDIWIVGSTGDPQMLLVKPLQSWFPPAGPVSFVAQFDPTGKNLKFSTFLGGTTKSEALGIAIDSNHRAHVSGFAEPGMYTTPGVYQGQVPASPPDVDDVYGYASLIDPAVTAPALCVAPNTGLRWPGVMVGTTVDLTLTLTNCGVLPLTIDGIQTAGLGAFSAFSVPPDKNQCSQSLAVGQSCTAAVRFAPSAVAAYNSTVTIQTNAPIPEAVLDLKGSGVAPQISVMNTPVFDFALVGQTTQPAELFVRNLGDGPLTIDFAKTTTTGPFSLSPNQLCTQPVQAGGMCGIALLFTPKAAGSQTGSVLLASNDPKNPVLTVPLFGTGYSAAPAPEITYVDSPTVADGSTNVTLGVSGFGFLPDSVVQVNGKPQKTSYVNAGFITAALDPGAIPTSGYGEIPVTVFTPSPGGGNSAPYDLTLYQELHTQNAGLLYEPVSKELFASIPAGAATNANTVLPIDPATATAGTPIPVGNDPGHLAASADGKYLYVALNGDHTIERINLSTKAVERTFPLPADPSLGATTVSDMHVVPGQPTEVVASLATKGSPSEAGVALFNDSGLVNYIPSSFTQNGMNISLMLDNFAFTSDPSKLYGVPFDRSGNSPYFTVLTLDASGLHYSPPSGGLNGGDNKAGFLVTSDGSLLYTSGGEVWDPGTGKLLHTYPLTSTLSMNSVVPDSTTGNTYFLDPAGRSDQTSALTIRAFNQSSLSETGDLSIMKTPGVSFPDESLQLERWGATGFAFRYDDNTGTFAADDGIVMLTSKIATGAGNLNPSPVAATLSPASVAAASADFTLTVTGSGFVSGSTVEWNGAPRVTTFVSSSQLTATIYAADIAAQSTAQVTVASPGPGGGVSQALPFTVTAPIPPSPKLVVSPDALTFASQAAGVTSAAQTITVENTGEADATGFVVALTGANASSFSQMNTCTSTVAAGASCTIDVAFAPEAAGTDNASLELTFHESASPLMVSLTGTATAEVPFTVAPPSSSGGTATVTAGQSASYTLVLTPSPDYSGTITPSCADLPAHAACTFTPSSISVTKGQQPVSFTVDVSTSETQSAALRFLTPLAAPLLGFCCVPFWSRRRRWKSFMLGGTLAVILVAVGIVSGCGGGGGGGGSTAPAPPPTTATVAPGTYTIQVVFNDGSTTVKQPLTLVVK